MKIFKRALIIKENINPKRNSNLIKCIRKITNKIIKRKTTIFLVIKEHLQIIKQTKRMENYIWIKKVNKKMKIKKKKFRFIQNNRCLLSTI